MGSQGVQGPRTRRPDPAALSIHGLEEFIQQLKAPTLLALNKKARPYLEELFSRRAALPPTRQESRELLRGFEPAEEGPGTLALTREIERRMKRDPTLSYGAAVVLVGRECPDLAEWYLAESRGAKPMPGKGRSGVAEKAWREANCLYARMTDAQRARTIPPLVARQWLSRWQPVYFLTDKGAVLGAGGDRLLGQHYGVTSREPAYASVPLLGVALNLEWSITDILATIEAILRLRPKSAVRRNRYTQAQMGQVVVWYYRRHRGVPLKVLASEEADRPRRRRGAATPSTANAVDQAAKRIRAGIAWFEQQFPRVTPPV